VKFLDNRPEIRIYYLVNEGFRRWYEFMQEIFKLAKISKKIKSVDRNGLSGGIQRPKFSALKNTKARALGIVLPTWQEGLIKYIDFLNLN